PAGNDRAGREARPDASPAKPHSQPPPRGIPPSPSAAPLQAQSGHPLPTTTPPTLGAEQYIEKDKYCLYLILIIISISALTSKQIPKEDFHGIHPVPYHRRRSRGRHPAGLLDGGAHRHRPQAVAVLEP